MAAANYSPPETALIKATRADFDRRDVVQPVHLVQYDDTLPVLAVDLYKGGQPWTLPTGADVNLRMDKKDGHYVYNPALGVSSDRNTVYLAVTAQMTTGYGTFAPVVEVLAGGGVAGMAALRLEIDRNPVQDGMLESTDEYKTVQVLAAEVAANAKIVRDNEAGIQDVHENIEAIKAAPANATAAAATIRPAMAAPRSPRRSTSGGRGSQARSGSSAAGSSIFPFTMSASTRLPFLALPRYGMSAAEKAAKSS